MSDTTRDRIIDAAVALLRRHGPAKVTVTDVARSLGMSHGNVYRHFTSKADLLDTIAERWLSTVSVPLQAIVDTPIPAGERLEAWVFGLARLKQGKLNDDRELFAVYHSVAEEAREVVARHIETLLAQLERIVSDGVVSGEFRVQDRIGASLAVWNATQHFHHPALLCARPEPPGEGEIRALTALLLAGLRAGVT